MEIYQIPRSWRLRCGRGDGRVCNGMGCVLYIVSSNREHDVYLITVFRVK